MGSSAHDISDQRSPKTIKDALWYESLTDPRQLRPRVRMALRLYVHAAADDIGSAALAVGLHPNYLRIMSRTEAGKKFMETAHTHINNTALQTTELIEKLSRRAIEVIGTQMEDASSEGLRLKAAIDLADRGAETSKVHKHQVESFTLSSQDARGIAESLVAAAALKARHSDLGFSNFDRVNVDVDDSDVPVVVPNPTLRLEP